MVLWGLAALSAAAAPMASALRSPYGDLLHEADGGFRTIVSAGLWVMFAVMAVVLLLPGALPLTAARIVLPANAAASLWAAVSADPLSPLGHSLSLGVGLAAAVVALTPAFAEAVVDADSYGDERRYLLRPPGPVLVAVVAPMWVIAVSGVTAGPLLLADRRWAAGAAVASVGVPAAAIAWVVLHRLARRWLVFVPGGLVIHDRMTIGQPIPLSRRGVASIGPAPADTTAADFTAKAFGLALELRLSTPISMAGPGGGGQSSSRGVESVLIAPSRPAAVMATAEKRGIAIA